MPKNTVFHDCLKHIWTALSLKRITAAFVPVNRLQVLLKSLFWNIPHMMKYSKKYPFKKYPKVPTFSEKSTLNFLLKIIAVTAILRQLCPPFFLFLIVLPSHSVSTKWIMRPSEGNFGGIKDPNKAILWEFTPLIVSFHSNYFIVLSLQ